MVEGGEPIRRKRIKRFHPMMFEGLSRIAGEPGDPIGILMGASLIRDDFPWLYEIYMDAYRAVKAGDLETVEREIIRLRRVMELTMHGPFGEIFEPRSREEHMIMMEFPRMVEHMLRRCLEEKRSTARPVPYKKKA
jgi:hypothetical protein